MFNSRRSDPVANAMLILADKTRASEAYRNALAATIKELVEDPRLNEVSYLRSVGGWSQLIRDTWAKHAGDAMTAGSKLLPPVPLAKFFPDLQDVRITVQIERGKKGVDG